jgi:hypothetical protein
VLQGSDLTPPLCAFYIKDIPVYAREYVALSADVSILFSADANTDVGIMDLQHALTNFKNWCSKSGHRD